MVGDYDLAFFVELDAINTQFANMLMDTEEQIGSQIIPSSLCIPPSAATAPRPPALVANIDAPYLSLPPGVQGLVRMHLPLRSGSLLVRDMNGDPKSFDLTPPPGGAKFELVWDVNLSLAGLAQSNTVQAPTAQEAIASVAAANVFSVQVLFLDFENAKFIEESSVIPPAVAADPSMTMDLGTLLGWYVDELSKNAKNPYVLGYTLNAQPGLPPAVGGPFAPARVDFSVTAPGSITPKPTLNYWVVTRGGTEPTDPAKQIVSSIPIAAGQDGLLVLGGHVLLSPILEQIASSSGMPGSFAPSGGTFTNGQTYDSGADNYDCFRVDVTPSGASLQVRYSIHRKVTSSKKLSSIIGGLFAMKFDWNPLHHLPHPPDVDPDVRYWATLQWSRTDVLTFTVGTDGSLVTGYTRGLPSSPVTDSGCNQSGEIVKKIANFLSGVANDLSKGTSWVLGLANIDVSIPSVDLSPSLGSVGFRTPKGAPAAAPFMLPTGDVVIPANPRFDADNNLMLDVSYNSNAS